MYPSTKPFDLNAVYSFWQPFVRVFQMFAVSHYSLFRPNVRIGHLIYHLSFSCAHLSLMTYTLKHVPHLHIIEDEQYKEYPLMYYVSLMSVLANFATHAVANLEPLLSKIDEEQIYQRLTIINEAFAKLNLFVITMQFEKRLFDTQLPISYLPQLYHLVIHSIHFPKMGPYVIFCFAGLLQSL